MKMENVFPLKNSLGVVMVQCEAVDCLNVKDVEKNVNQLCDWVDRSSRAYPGADLIVFPECSTQGAHPDAPFEIFTEIPGPLTDRLARTCIKNQIWGVFNLLEKNENPTQRPFNITIIINHQGNIILKQHKINPFVPLETAIPGDELMVYAGPKKSVFGIMTCYDGDFPEVARELAMKGANILLRPASYMEPYSEAWKFVNQARAYENIAYVIAVNRVGTSHIFTWFGGSMAIDFDGRIIKQSPLGIPWMTKVDLPIPLVEEARKEYKTGNHLFNLKHRGYAGLPPEGDTRNIYSVYREWI